MMQIEQLWAEIDGRVVRLPSEKTGCLSSLDRIAGEDILSPVDLPVFDQSSMDGFAFSSLEPGVCRITGAIAAGSPVSIQPALGTALRILTGGLVPGNTLCIVRQEDCEVSGREVSVRSGVLLEAGMNIRRRGGVFSEGQRLLESGTLLSAGALALLASAGIEFVDVVGRGAVLHMVTGDEVVPAGKSLPPGKIYDSNGPMIAALLAEFAMPVRTVHLDDNLERLEKSVADCTESLLLISGGAGPGDRDHTLQALKSAGFVIHSTQLNSRPGKPLIFATRGDQVAFGLPGNPLSHWVCFQAFVKRAIRRLLGIPEPEMPVARLSKAMDVTGDGRRTWTPGRYEISNAGLRVCPLPWKHSGDLTPLIEANTLILDPSSDGTARVIIL